VVDAEEKLRKKKKSEKMGGKKNPSIFFGQKGGNSRVLKKGKEPYVYLL